MCSKFMGLFLPLILECDLIAIAICGSNSRSQITSLVTSDSRQCEPSQKSSVLCIEGGVAILAAMWTEVQVT